MGSILTLGRTVYRSGEASSAIFAPLYTLFDGVDDAIQHYSTNPLLGGGSGSVFTLSMMLRPDVLAGGTLHVIFSGFFKVRLKEYDAGFQEFAWRILGGSATLRGNANEYLTATETYHLHLAVDYSSTLIKSASVNGVSKTITEETTDVIGTFSFGDLVTGFWGNASDPPTAQPQGCLGPVWFMRDVYEPDATKFYDTVNALPYNWATHTPVTDLGTPELFVPDWLDKSGVEIVNAGSSGNIAWDTGDPTFGDPTRCS